MSVLAILLPLRPRSTTGGDGPPAPRSASGMEWAYAFSRDTRTVEQQGSAPAAQLPKAERAVLVVQEDDIAWLPVQLPKVTASRLREALGGALEDQLLEEPHLTHLALNKAGLREGQTNWVAALHKPWLEQQIRLLREEGIEIDALVSLSEPDDASSGHAGIGSDGQPRAIVVGPHGVALWALGWPGWKTRLEGTMTWTAEPAAASALSEAGMPAARLLNQGDRMLAAAVSGSNLLQFDLAPRMKGSRALLAVWSAFRTPRYRAIHVGLALMLLIQVIGLNASAWRSQRETQTLQARAEEVLRQTFPSVKVVVDPRVQMEREVQSLRQAAGLAGPTDLETWIDLVATLWAGQPEPLLKFQLSPQGLSLEATQWPPDVVAALQEHARQQGWQARVEGNQLKLAPAGAAR